MNDPEPDPASDAPDLASDSRPFDVTLDVDAPDAPDARWLLEHLHAAADLLRLVDPLVSIAVVDDEQMAELHERYSGISGTTDVLTFDLADDPIDARDLLDRGRPIDGVEGEIVVCLDEARRRATERGHALERELLLYCIHGLLHLIGFDDHDPDDYRAMHAREDAVLSAIGVGPVFSPAGSPEP